MGSISETCRKKLFYLTKLSHQREVSNLQLKQNIENIKTTINIDTTQGIHFRQLLGELKAETDLLQILSTYVVEILLILKWFM